VDGKSYNSPQLAWSMKSKKRKSHVGTLCANRKNAHPVVKNAKLKTGENCGQHSGDAAVLAYQDKKRVTSTYHKQSKPRIKKPVLVHIYSVNMLRVDLKIKRYSYTCWD
jgi:hypothetical protein